METSLDLKGSVPGKLTFKAQTREESELLNQIWNALNRDDSMLLIYRDGVSIAASKVGESAADALRRMLNLS